MKSSVKLEVPDKKGLLLWKYMDLHKFLYLLIERKLFFTRLDQFSDPFEGVPTKLLRGDAKYSDIPYLISDFSDSVPKSDRRRLINEKLLHEYTKAKKIEQNQREQYVNCWITSDRESMAMWNIYSNRDSVAIKTSFACLESLSTSFEKFIKNNGYRFTIVGDVVKYLKLNPFDASLKKQNIEFSALKKDVSFEYEKEFRFLLVTKIKLDKQPVCFEIPIEIEELNFTIVTHPNMEQWKFNNIKTLIQMANLKINLEKSATVLKNID